MTEHEHVWSAWTTEARVDGAESIQRLVRRCYTCGKAQWEDDAGVGDDLLNTEGGA